MDKILRGVVNYTKHARKGMLADLQRLKEDPKVCKTFVQNLFKKSFL